MSARPQRVTNGQRAAVCALILAGLSRTEACEIVAAPHKLMHELLPPSWRTRKPSRPSRWRGPALESLRLAYADRSLTVAAVARQFNTTIKAVCQVAYRNDWPRRRRGARPLVDIESMTAKQRRQYRKIRPIIGREKALAEVRP